MPTLRQLAFVTIAAALLLPAATLAQDVVEPSSEAAASVVVDDPRLDELQALVPDHLAGLPLREEMLLATGEQLSERMAPDEKAVFEDMLSANGKSFADYAAGNVFVPFSDTTVVVVQAHRVSGIDAASTVDAWLEILGLNMERPRVVDETITGKYVALVSDDAQPDFPQLHLFAAGDVIWMVVADDAALAEEAVRTLSAASEPEPAAE